MIQLDRVSGGYTPHVDMIQNISFQVQQGSFVTLIGPNGSGKTTLLRMISGSLPFRTGDIYLKGRRLSEYTALQRASILTVLSQEHEVAFDFSVEEIVLLGRYPHQKGWLKTVSSEDEQVVEDAMRAAQVTMYRDQPFRALSGGEKQRVMLAKTLAQEPEVLLLDEPTNHLDIRHMHDLLQLLKTWQKTNKLTVLAVLHDLNIASLVSDRIILLHEGRLIDEGEASIMYNTSLLKRIYGISTLTQSHPLIPKPQVFLTPEWKREEKDQKTYQKWYTFHKDRHQIVIVFNRFLRTISSLTRGDGGFQWFRCFYVQSEPGKHQHDFRVPDEQATGIITKTERWDYEWLEMEEEGHALSVLSIKTSGTIHTFVFIDGYVTDGELVRAMMTATQARMKAMFEADVSETTKNHVFVAVTQREQKATHENVFHSMLEVMKKGVYQATRKLLVKAVHSYK